MEPTRSCASNRPLKVLERYFTVYSVVALALLAAHSQGKRYTTGAAFSDYPDVAPHTALAALNAKFDLSCAVWVV